MDSAIDISSDSDVEIQETRTRPQHPPRIAEGSHRRDLSTLRPHFLSGSSSGANGHTKTGLTNLDSRNGFESKPLPRAEHHTHIPGNGSIVTSRIPNISVGDYEKSSSQQAFKRTHPPTFSRPPFPPRPDIGTSNGNASHFRGGAHDDLGMGRVTNGTRILPPSVAHGTSASPSHFNGLSDPMHRNGIGEERNSENDERLIYQAALQELNQPKSEVDLPAGLLSVPLMKHQKIALAWMFQKETNSLHCMGGILADDQGLGKTVSTIALILKQMHEAKLKSKNSGNQEAEALDLDADDESENAFEKPESKASNGSGVNGDSGIKKAKGEEASTSTRKFNRKRPAAGTLIVCPASVVRQWARELDEKVTDEAKLSVLIYHGGNRTKDPIELAKYDVVMTTYAIVSNEVPKQPLVDDDENDEKNSEKYGLASGFSINKKRKNVVGTTKKSKKKKGNNNAGDSSDPDSGTLAKVGWFRVVLDEAQTIKNHRTQVARACCGLRAKRRWCLSGTPIQNTIDDLYSYFRFLKYDPYAVYKSFCHQIKGPISRNSLQGYKKLQAVLRAIMLRRTKGTLLDGQPIINLPPKTINLSQVDFSVEERSFYVKLESDSRSQFKAYAAAGTLNQNYANILLMLLRLRQACDHPQLVKRYNSDSVGKVSEEAVKKLPKEDLVSLLSRLESSPICCVCHDPPEDPVVTLCGHIFCYQCVSDYITGDEDTCPAPRCREQLAHDVVFSKSTLRSCVADDLGCSSSEDNSHDKSVFQNGEFSSSKIKAVLDILQSLSNQGTSNSTQNGQMASSSQQPNDDDDDDDDDDVTIVEKTSLKSTPSNGGPIKTIIFSQWTGMLDLVELSLIENSIEFRRLDGTMSLIARDRAVKEFSNDPDVSRMHI
ncbi:P-loop containing nucleoside triphosphate hydrolase [Arabidopsis suecica]|uniref:P-loop containing nucleoside triphosphate hydrolase n=1 Tax=Arabidopsis suecica TaxID=45249 RepID=A0A8T2HDM9_ARASU|nr:P-loop containing nucleoside triphosphate hydrolase [Arabidopsis suecica]